MILIGKHPIPVSSHSLQINAILAERDELYEILRMNEDAESARFANSQAFINFKQDAFNEQQRLRQRISALEEELEMSMCRLNQMNGEQNELKEQLHTLQGDRDSLEHEVHSNRQKYERELATVKEEYAQRENQYIETMKIKTDKLEAKCADFMAKDVEMNQTIADLQQKLSHKENEMTNVRTENLNLNREQNEREKLWNENLENLVRQKLIEKDEEIIQLNEKYFQQITDLTERLTGESRESINEIRNCYLERFEELQRTLAQNGSNDSDTHNELRGLEHKLDELLSRDTTEERQQEMYNALMNKLVELRLTNPHKCCSTSGEAAESVDRLVNLLRQELQQERERSSAEKMEAEKVRRNFEEYRADTDRRFLTCTLEIERIKINHEAEVFKIQSANEEKLNRITTQNAVELTELRNKLMTEHQEELHLERNSVGEAFEKGVQCASQILAEMIQEAGTTLDAWSARLNDGVGNNKKANNESFVPPEKEYVDNKFGLSESLVENSLVKAFHAQLLLVSRERSRQLVSALNHTLVDTQQRLDDLRHQLERERRDAQAAVCQLEHKAQLELEKSEQRHILEYQKKMQQLAESSNEVHLSAQLKQKDSEISELRTQIDSLESQLKDKMRTAMRLEYEKQLESKLLEPTKMVSNQDCLSGMAATRVVIELKNRIQRLREENLSLRRLLLRRLPSRIYTGSSAVEESKKKNRIQA
ncbi:hypothetical protein FGIG_05471 [Fasciola gigantica]|uniref:Uncharacterized protein n=1 Tax=Fasciola gigantica TaxID=46835 RepID=A0A504YKG3_FASGI|nr:hypothetical protein FGIG_05471 [Fasciola gigantica]